MKEIGRLVLEKNGRLILKTWFRKRLSFTIALRSTNEVICSLKKTHCKDLDYRKTALGQLSTQMRDAKRAKF